MHKMLEQLAVLQKVDTKLQELESLRGDLPHQVNRLENELGKAQQALSDLETEMSDNQKEKVAAEGKIKDLEESKKKYQSQLFNVKNNREYDAVTHEIETVSTEISENESRVLELMDLEEENNEKHTQAKEDLSGLNEQLSIKKKELNRLMAKTEKEEDALKKEKEQIVGKLDKKYFTNYDRIRKAKNGLAVVPIIRNGCGGCSRTLPPQRVLEIRDMNRLFLCEVCGRMLVWDEEAADTK